MQACGRKLNVAVTVQVQATDPKQNRLRTFEITTKWVANVDLSALLAFIQ